MPSSPPDPPWLKPHELDMWRAFVLMQMQLSAHLNRTLSAFDLTFQDYGVLARLSESSDGQARLTELATLSGFEKSRMSHHVDRMERRGLVARVKCDTDRRGAFVLITEAGLAALAAAAPTHVTDVRHHVFDQLAEGDVAVIERISKAIIAGL